MLNGVINRLDWTVEINRVNIVMGEMTAERCGIIEVDGYVVKFTKCPDGKTALQIAFWSKCDGH